MFSVEYMSESINLLLCFKQHPNFSGTRVVHTLNIRTVPAYKAQRDTQYRCYFQVVTLNRLQHGVSFSNYTNYISIQIDLGNLYYLVWSSVTDV